MIIIDLNYASDENTVTWYHKSHENVYLVYWKLLFQSLFTLQDMTRKSKHYEKWLWEDNSTNI